MRLAPPLLPSVALGLALALAAPLASAQPNGAPRTWGVDDPSEREPEPPPPPPSPPPAPVTPAPSEPPDLEPAPTTPRGEGKSLRYELEGVQVVGNTTTLARVVLRHVPFKTGDVLDVDDKELELTRFRLLGTGFFRDVQLSLRKGSRRGTVVLVVTVVERNTIVVNDVWLGVSADADGSGRARPLTAYGGLDVSETNLAGTGIALGGAVAIADGQAGVRTRFSDPQFLKSPWALEAQLLYNNAKDFFGNRDVLVDDPSQKVAQDFAVARYQRFGGSVGVGHDLGNPSDRLFLDYRLERLDASLPRAASHRRGLDVEPIAFYLVDGPSVLSSVRATVVHDTRDEPVLPSRGWHILAFAEGSLAPLGSDYPYAKMVVRASRWFTLPWQHVLRVEGIGGAIFGDAPLFEKFFVGDYSDLLPDRALELNFDRRPSPNFLGTVIPEVRWGDYAARVTAEYRIPIYRGKRTTYGVDLFASGGAFVLADKRDVTQPARGYSGVSKIPADLTFNLGLKIDTAAGGFTIGTSTLIGFLPVRGEAK